MCKKILLPVYTCVYQYYVLSFLVHGTLYLFITRYRQVSFVFRTEGSSLSQLVSLSIKRVPLSGPKCRAQVTPVE